MDEILDELLPDLMDIYEHKQVRLIRKREEQPFIIRCNHSLAQILVSNLVKNSLLHNREEGELQVLTTPTSLVIKNTGDVPLDGEKLFRRFYHGMDGKKDSTGLGLAIARSIALSSSLKLTYEWQDVCIPSVWLKKVKFTVNCGYSQIFPNSLPLFAV